MFSPLPSNSDDDSNDEEHHEDDEPAGRLDEPRPRFRQRPPDPSIFTNYALASKGARVLPSDLVAIDGQPPDNTKPLLLHDVVYPERPQGGVPVKTTGNGLAARIREALPYCTNDVLQSTFLPDRWGRGVPVVFIVLPRVQEVCCVGYSYSPWDRCYARRLAVTVEQYDEEEVQKSDTTLKKRRKRRPHRRIFFRPFGSHTDSDEDEDDEEEVEDVFSPFRDDWEDEVFDSSDEEEVLRSSIAGVESQDDSRPLYFSTPRAVTNSGNPGRHCVETKWIYFPPCLGNVVRLEFEGGSGHRLYFAYACGRSQWGRIGELVKLLVLLQCGRATVVPHSVSQALVDLLKMDKATRMKAIATGTLDRPKSVPSSDAVSRSSSLRSQGEEELPKDITDVTRWMIDAAVLSIVNRHSSWNNSLAGLMHRMAFCDTGGNPVQSFQLHDVTQQILSFL